MQTEQFAWTETEGWFPPLLPQLGGKAQMVLIFGMRSRLEDPILFSSIQQHYPHASIIGCSTAGNILDTSIIDTGLTVTAVWFERSSLIVRKLKIDPAQSIEQAGATLAKCFPQENLRHLFVLSHGTNINGSELVRGLNAILPEEVAVTGGLAGDDNDFQDTVILADQPAENKLVLGIGLYGSSLRVGYGSVGGWDPFGPERLITKSEGNILHEMDSHSALDLYRNYLGPYAEGLPATGLLFPLSIRSSEQNYPIVRTILGINEDTKSLIFAGDVPQGNFARLMKANFDRIIDGAGAAVELSCKTIQDRAPDLAILISCVGRKLVLRQRAEEEIEAVREALGDATTLTGFYSYGEICPYPQQRRSSLHNQTMTITTLWEE